MRHRIGLLLLVPLLAGWIESTHVGVPENHPREVKLLFLGTQGSAPPLYQIGNVTQPGGPPPPNVWQTIDLTTLGVPADVNAILVVGFLIITSGTNSNTPDLAVSFQRFGGPQPTPVDAYNAQAIANGPNSGYRGTFAVVVPVQAGKIQFGWLRGDGSTWPDQSVSTYPYGASYVINISIQAYFRP
jgi:hypothetical protein